MSTVRGCFCSLEPMTGGVRWLVTLCENLPGVTCTTVVPLQIYWSMPVVSAHSLQAITAKTYSTPLSTLLHTLRAHIHSLSMRLYCCCIAGEFGTGWFRCWAEIHSSSPLIYGASNQHAYGLLTVLQHARATDTFLHSNSPQKQLRLSEYKNETYC